MKSAGTYEGYVTDLARHWLKSLSKEQLNEVEIYSCGPHPMLDAVAKLAKEGKTSSQVGLFLRDTYGIPDVKKITGESITQIMEKRNLAPKLPEDLLALMIKSVAVQKHFETNKKDMTSKRGIQLTDAKIRRLVKYYKRTNKLPADFKYDPSNLRMYIE